MCTLNIVAKEFRVPVNTVTSIPPTDQTFGSQKRRQPSIAKSRDAIGLVLLEVMNLSQV